MFYCQRFYLQPSQIFIAPKPQVFQQQQRVCPTSVRQHAGSKYINCGEKSKIALQRNSNLIPLNTTANYFATSLPHINSNNSSSVSSLPGQQSRHPPPLSRSSNSLKFSLFYDLAQLDRSSSLIKLLDAGGVMMIDVMIVLTILTNLVLKQAIKHIILHIYHSGVAFAS